MGSFEGFPGEKFTKLKWVLNLAGQSETSVWGSIEKRVTNKYWMTLKQKLTTAKEIIPSKCRIGETCCTSMDIIGVKLFSNNPNI